ncbi:CDP-glycerol glycerophosphotransferase family protein [Campylobacter coli]|uniref:CDP-glycerol glycerophosphotransferase family protein n=2 Tax=Campylobacter coli TaxID=195 RepID=UPI000930E5BF|nr:CDP-glycerol glycerophosphotransferase family protein [Campylobacter coli]
MRNFFLQLDIFILNILYYIFYFSCGRKVYTCFIENETSIYYKNVEILYKYFKEHSSFVVKINYKSNLLYKIWIISQSRIVFVDQADSILSKISLHKKTDFVQLWHAGGAYKAFGFDAYKEDRDVKSEFSRIKRIHGKYTHVVISDNNLRNIMSKAYNMQEDKILALGLVRSDLMYKINNLSEIKNKILNFYNIKNDVFIVMYCPTFRTENEKRYSDINFLEVVEKAVSLCYNKYCILYRNHPSIQLSKKYFSSNIIDVSNRVDIVELMASADMLITDYSSILFDFAYFSKPIVLFVPDLKEYVSNNRKLYFQPEDLVGKQMVARNFDELYQCILNPIVSDKIWHNFMSACDGQVCKKIYHFFSKSQL